MPVRAVHGGTGVVSVRAGPPCRVDDPGRTVGPVRLRGARGLGMPFTDRGLFFARLEPMRSYGIALPLAGPAPEGMYSVCGTR